MTTMIENVRVGAHPIHTADDTANSNVFQDVRQKSLNWRRGKKKKTEKLLLINQSERFNGFKLNGAQYFSIWMQSIDAAACDYICVQLLLLHILVVGVAI